jgi:hypothetical protein
MTPTRLACLTTLAASCLLSAQSIPATTPVMPVDQIRPGMSGVGVTVFEGVRREEFRVQILGVLKNLVGPRRDLILARLDGGPLAATGVIQGMSGSPVYIDGRLIGAISYSLGAFAKEPIAGITPIAEMQEAATLPVARPVTAQKARLEWPVSPDALAGWLRAHLGAVEPFADSPRDVDAVGLPRAVAAQLGAMLRPVGIPLVMSGFDQEARDLLATALRDQGFAPVVGGAADGLLAPEEPLQPGDPIGVGLIRGDLLLAGVGTVTMVDGDRVYAFGHRFLNLGPTQFPMMRAYVHAVLPSLFTSSKIASVGEVVGTFQQDRATAIAGTLGPGPRMIPISIALEAADRKASRQFTFEVVSDQVFTPLLTYAVVLNTLRSYEREFGTATFTVRGRASLKGHPAVAFEDIFAGDAPSAGAATYVAAPITFLLTNDFEPVEIERVDLTITSSEQPRLATLERVWIDEVRPRAGQTVPLKILTRTYRGDEVLRTVPIEIPAYASGTLSILVADGTRLAQWEQRELRQALQPQNVAQMIRALNKARRNNRLYVRLLSREPGAVVNGELLAALPPSVLAVFDADAGAGNITPLRSATLGEWELATDYAVRGFRLLTITVEPR